MTNEFYQSNVEFQWKRHESVGRVESRVLERLLKASISGGRRDVVDIGGGSGKFAAFLESLNKKVVLCDLVLDLVEEYKKRQVERGVLGRGCVADARSLPFANGSFDAAVLFGPMYSLHSEGDRALVLSEARRVVRPGGVLVLQYFSRLAGLRWAAEAYTRDVAIFDWASYLDSGVFQDEHMPEALKCHYFSTPKTIEKELVEAGLRLTQLRGVDGPAPTVGQANLRRAPSAIVEQWADIAEAVTFHDRDAASCTHLVAIATR